MIIENAIIIAIITAISQVVLYVLGRQSEKRKTAADVYAIDAGTINDYIETINKLRRELADVDNARRADNRALQAEIDNIRAEARATAAEYEKQIKELTTRIQALEAENSHLKQENEKLKGSHNE